MCIVGSSFGWPRVAKSDIYLLIKGFSCAFGLRADQLQQASLMDVSENRGYPQIIDHPFWGTPYFWKQTCKLHHPKKWSGLQIQRWQQVVIQLDPLDTGAEAFALTAPCAAPVMLRVGDRWLALLSTDVPLFLSLSIYVYLVYLI